LQAWKSDQQYLVSNRVTDAEVDDKRDGGIGKHTRITYYTNTNLLIIKLMPLEAHERAPHLVLAGEFRDKILLMGVPTREIIPVGSRHLKRATQHLNVALFEKRLQTSQQLSLRQDYLSR
jgi:hypothetical protein